VRVDDERIAELVQRCRRLDGEHLFQYVDADGHAHAVQSSEVNDYLRNVARADVTAKDFRTWMATLMVGTALAAMPAPPTTARMRREVNTLLDVVAGRLRNTRAVCRASYIHLAVLEAFADGTLAERWRPSGTRRVRGMTSEERSLLFFLGSLESATRAL